MDSSGVGGLRERPGLWRGDLDVFVTLSSIWSSFVWCPTSVFQALQFRPTRCLDAGDVGESWFVSGCEGAAVSK